MKSAATNTSYRPLAALLALGLAASFELPPVCSAGTGLPTANLIAPFGGSNENMGTSVAGAGDVNGDGYPDVIVGAPQDASGLPGKAYVFYGGPNADNVPDLVLNGVANQDAFGSCVSSAGDLNRDGYADVMVGAPHNDAGASNGGRVYIYFGGPSPDNVPDLVLTGLWTSGYFGQSLASVGDVNADGYDDVLIGAPGESTTGRAFLLFGGATPDAIPDVTLSGDGGSQFGSSVAAAGDVNGDGVRDFLVCAPNFSTTDGTLGKVWLYYGTAGAGLSTADVVWIGTTTSGINRAAASDMNGDGFSDIAISAPGTNNKGIVSLYFGGPAIDASADVIFTGITSNGFFGQTVAPAGDVNGDGFGDLLVSTENDGTGGIAAGSGFVFFGGPLAGGSGDLTFTGFEGERLGVSAAGVGDFDGDGLDDFVLGARVESNFTNTGRAFVIGVRPLRLESPNGGETWIAGRSQTVRWHGPAPVDIALSLDGGATWSTVASYVGGAAVNDYTVYAPHTTTEFARVRVTYVGQPATPASVDASDGLFRIVPAVVPPPTTSRVLWQAPGAASGDRLGMSVSTTGDFNGDGYPDVIVGAPYSDPGGKVDAGRVYVYYGGPGSDALPDLTLSGVAAGDLFGWSLAMVDVNRDGFKDLLVGAPVSDLGALDAGAFFTYYGGPSADANADQVTYASVAGNQLGYAIAAIGDFNADGYPDYATAEPTDDVNGTNSGKVAITLGGPAGGGWVLRGATAQEQFGWALAGGDVNGDGVSDLIVSAPYRTVNGAFGAGAICVYYGGKIPTGAPDQVISGGEANATMGSSLAVGDLDGDGRADILAGTPGSGGGKGVAFLISGAPSLSGPVRLDGEAAGDAFGYSVACGDVNSDGYSDVIVGAPAAVAGAGKVYVFFGGPGFDTRPDRYLVGNSASQFGVAVAVVGDVFGAGAGPDVAIGAPLDGGTGRVYLYGFPRFLVTSPNGGESWPVGANREIRWQGAALADVWLSLDGGKSYDLLRSGLGGAEQSVFAFRVPHTPTRFARLKVTATDVAVSGADETDSLFTIQTSVSLLALLAAPAPNGRGAELTWKSDPGPEDLAGYRLERASASQTAWQTLVGLTRETSYVDETAGPDARYRLFAVNGLGEALLLGETEFRPRAPLAAWPLPYRGGALSISFATFGGLGGGTGDAELDLFDVSGRLVRHLARSRFPAGYQSISWDGKDERGVDAPTGIYFLRAKSAAGSERTLKVAVVR